MKGARAESVQIQGAIMALVAACALLVACGGASPQLVTQVPQDTDIRIASGPALVSNTGSSPTGCVYGTPHSFDETYQHVLSVLSTRGFVEGLPVKGLISNVQSSECVFIYPWDEGASPVLSPAEKRRLQDAHAYWFAYVHPCKGD